MNLLALALRGCLKALKVNPQKVQAQALALEKALHLNLVVDNLKAPVRYNLVRGLTRKTYTIRRRTRGLTRKTLRTIA